VASAKNNILASLDGISDQIQNIKIAALGLKTGQLKDSLAALNGELQTLNEKVDGYGITDLLSIIGQFNSSLKEIPGAFKNITAISDKSAQIADDIDYLKNNAFQLLFKSDVSTGSPVLSGHQSQNELITRLEDLERNLSGLEKISADFKNQARKIKNLDSRLASLYDIFDANYLSINLSIYRSKELVSALLSLLKSPGEIKILVLFQNPTEMRPAGGFIGSFGYITLSGGGIKEIKIDDIYNADRQLNVKFAPPRELSGITDKWGARDANWFLNFPDSAKKVAFFLENSKLFSDSILQPADGFNHVISINTNILKSLLDITGPIEIPGYKLTIGSDNFLTELQREVEAGQDKKPGQNPKRVLSVLAPLLIDKLKNLDDAGKLKLIANLKQAAGQKDIMAFSENESLQKMFIEYNLAGEVFNIPKSFNGDYLAIANSNIAGGKSDAFISQRIKLTSQIMDDGSIDSKLSVSRKHTGQNEKDWWYRATNKNYAKIFISPAAEIISISGNDSSPYKYTATAKGLLTDQNLENIEKNSVFLDALKIWNGEENGKQYVGAWVNTAAGKTKTVELEYRQNKKVRIKDGAAFEFVFDKQSGSDSSLEYEITAPPGYFWEESGQPIFSYGTQQIKSREIIRLTLIQNSY